MQLKQKFLTHFFLTSALMFGFFANAKGVPCFPRRMVVLEVKVDRPDMVTLFENLIERLLKIQDLRLEAYDGHVWPEIKQDKSMWISVGLLDRGFLVEPLDDYGKRMEKVLSEVSFFPVQIEIKYGGGGICGRFVGRSEPVHLPDASDAKGQSF